MYTQSLIENQQTQTWCSTHGNTIYIMNTNESKPQQSQNKMKTQTKCPKWCMYKERLKESQQQRNDCRTLKEYIYKWLQSNNKLKLSQTKQ